MNPPLEDDPGLNPDDKRRLLAIEGFLALGLPEEAHAEFLALDQHTLNGAKACHWGLRLGRDLNRWDIAALCALRLMRLEPGCGHWVWKWNQCVAHEGVPAAVLEALERTLLSIQGSEWEVVDVLLCAQGAALLGQPEIALDYLRRAVALNSSILQLAMARPELAAVVKDFKGTPEIP